MQLSNSNHLLCITNSQQMFNIDLREKTPYMSNNKIMDNGKLQYTHMLEYSTAVKNKWTRMIHGNVDDSDIQLSEKSKLCKNIYRI